MIMKKPSKRVKRKVYPSTRRNDARKADMVRDAFGGWADFCPDRTYGVYAYGRGTYKHNGETKML